MTILNFRKPKSAQPTIDSYGQASSGVSQEQIQWLMEWLFASLLNAGYCGKSHLIWYNSDRPNPSLERVMKKAMHRCGGRAMQPPAEYYWRMMDEHPSMRIYQLEVSDGE